MNTKRIIIDDRVEMKVSVDPLTENTLYCRPFEEDIHNISAFIINGQEFVHKYNIGLDNKTYINTNVITEDGDIYNDVRFKVVVVEKGDLPLSILNIKAVSNQDVINENRQEKNIVDVQHIENIISEKVYEYKQNLLVEFLALTEEHQKHKTQNLEQFEQLKENINVHIEQSLSNITKDVVQDMLSANNEIADTLVEKFKVYEKSLKEQTTEIINESVQNVSKQLAEHEENVIKLIRPRIEETTLDILKEKIETIESLLTLDKKVNELIVENTNLKQTVTQLAGERQTLKTLVESAKSYTDAQVSRASRDAEYYARRILDLGGGGGTVATQFANGGVMNGDLTINGNILSGGNNLVNVFAGEGGGDDNPINGGVY